MTTNHSHPDDREGLSALFDGAMKGDAARFALKRLEHDAQWQQSLSRWQLIGDAMRGQATAAAAPDFAARVAKAVAAEAVVPAVAAPVSTTPRRRWIGGAALAASVAMAALFVSKPFSSDSTPVRDTPAQVAAATPSAQPATTTEPAVQTPSIVSDTAPLVTAVAVAETARRVDRRSSRGQSQRAALRSSRREIETPVVAVAASTTSAPSDQTSPFDPQHAEIASKPWPRAVLPNYPASGSLTANYGGANSPSFYPFEPATPTSEPAPSP